MARQLAARRRRVTRPCDVCGRLTTGTGKRRYCSVACGQKAKYRRAKALRALAAAEPPADTGGQL